MVDDAPEIVALVEGLLVNEGFDVLTASDGETALECMSEFDPEVVVLDLALPGMDGVATCLQIRTFSDAYILMLTGKGAEADRVIGLTAGADDYLAKPFSSRELVARVHALLRRPRAREATGHVRRLGDLVVDPVSRTVTVGERPVELTKTEFDLLDALASSPGLTLSRGQLVDRVWGPSWYGDDHVVDVHMSKLRRKLGDDPRSPRYIETVRGFGFRIERRTRPR